MTPVARSEGLHREAPAVRVLIKRDLKKLTIGPGNYVLKTERGDPVSRGADSITIGSEGGSLTTEGRRLTQELTLDSRVPVAVDGRKYSGRIILHATEGGIDIIDLIDLERYVASVLKSEIPESFHRDAKKTIALAIRTYAVYMIEKGEHGYYHLDNSNLSQVYNGIAGIGAEYINAVEDTKGYIVTYNGEPALTVYHSTCGGRTENSSGAWKSEIPYLRSVACGYCTQSPSYRWDLKIPSKEMLNALKKEDIQGTHIVFMRDDSLTDTGRVKTLLVKTEKGASKIQSYRLRELIGFDKIKSLYFTIKVRKGTVIIKGKGYGHGVGLCQYGADGLAGKGTSYPGILKYYYGSTMNITKYYR